MTIASRLYTGLAAIALVMAGIASVAPSSARAAPGITEEALLALGIFTAATVAAFVIIDEEGDDEDPQSP